MVEKIVAALQGKVPLIYYIGNGGHLLPVLKEHVDVSSEYTLRSAYAAQRTDNVVRRREDRLDSKVNVIPLDSVVDAVRSAAAA